MSEWWKPVYKEPPPAPKEYLDAIRAALKVQTDAIADRLNQPRWTDKELDDYRDSGGWNGYFADGYSARDAMLEDMSYWDD